MIRSSRGDTYKGIPSTLVKCGTLDDALVLVRRSYPEAYMEGSTGFQRSFWVTSNEGVKMVGHAWTTNSGTGLFYRVRIFNDPYCHLTTVNCHQTYVELTPSHNGEVSLNASERNLAFLNQLSTGTTVN